MDNLITRLLDSSSLIREAADRIAHLEGEVERANTRTAEEIRLRNHWRGKAEELSANRRRYPEDELEKFRDTIAAIQMVYDSPKSVLLLTSSALSGKDT